MNGEQSGGVSWTVFVAILGMAFGVNAVSTVFTEALIEKLLEPYIESVAGVIQTAPETVTTSFSYLTTLIATLILFYLYKVWQRLENDAVEGSANWIKRHTIGFFANHHQKYTKYLSHRHRDFDVKGLSTQGIYTLMLQEVFVELSIAPQTLHDASVNPIQARIPEAMQAGQHTVWEFLASEQIANQHHPRKPRHRFIICLQH